MTKIVNADLNIEAGDTEAEIDAIRAETNRLNDVARKFRATWDAETARLLSLRGTDGQPLYVAGGPTGARLALV